MRVTQILQHFFRGCPLSCVFLADTRRVAMSCRVSRGYKTRASRGSNVTDLQSPLTTMNLTTLSRSAYMLSRRVFTPRPSQLVRFRSSSTTYSITLSTSSVLRLDIAVTSKEVALKLVETEADATETRAVGTTIGTAVGSDKESPGSVKSTKVRECWVDASYTHIGIVIGRQYKTFALKEGWMIKTRDINWAETAAVELAVQIASQRRWQGIIKIKSDCQAAVLAMFGGKVRVPLIMESARRKDDVLKTSNFTIEVAKVSSKDNIAHQFSAGGTVSVEGYTKLEGDIIIPEALVPFVEEI
ncbi:unnamed protein product [Rhizoctonia solani]|uniref:Uncharacterized protein n=1 Tax=Rhizoctonia solani TaxID=456999 RepID=A0A8H3GNV5_9AGAM|nr:unnamed protein product [Rhizoctonia solani]